MAEQKVRLGKERVVGEVIVENVHYIQTHIICFPAEGNHGTVGPGELLAYMTLTTVLNICAICSRSVRKFKYTFFKLNTVLQR